MEISSEGTLRLLAELTDHHADGSATSTSVSEHALLATASLGSEERYEAAVAYVESSLKLLDGSDESSQIVGSQKLALAAQEGSSQLVVQLFQQWCDKLLGVTRSAANSPVLISSCWHALGLLYSRIGYLLEVPGVRREASQHARVIAQTLLQVDSEGRQVPLQAAQLRALPAIIGAIPAAFKACSIGLEELLVETVLLSETADTPQRLAASHALSKLPQAAGEPVAWSLLTQRLLVTSHLVLDAAFLGLEDADLVVSVRSSVQPNARRLGANRQWHPGNTSAERESGLLAILGGLLDCLERLMTASQPAPVAIPSAAFYMLATRILSFDDSALASGRVPPSTSAYLKLIGALPSLHAVALRLVQIWLHSGRASLTPFHATASRLLGDLLMRVSVRSKSAHATWQVQQQVCLTSSALVSLAGFGAAREILQPALTCAVAVFVNTRSSTNPDAGKANLSKKRKKSKQKDAELAAISSAGDAAKAAQAILSGVPFERQAGTQQACLHLLHTLLTSGGAAFRYDQRLQLDCIVLHAATLSSKDLSQLVREAHAHSREEVAVQRHLAALRALLASVLSPCASRPAFLPQAAALFQQGLNASHPELAAFCKDALLSCEALLHPRAVPHHSRPAEPPSTSPAATLQQLLLPVSTARKDAIAGTATQPDRADRWQAGAQQPTGIAAESTEQDALDVGRAQGDGSTALQSTAAEDVSGEKKRDRGAAEADQNVQLMEIVAPAAKADASFMEHEAEQASAAMPLTAATKLPETVPLPCSFATSVQKAALTHPELAQNGGGVVQFRSALAGAMTSDSEGPMPEIDSGVSSEDNSEDE